MLEPKYTSTKLNYMTYAMYVIYVKYVIYDMYGALTYIICMYVNIGVKKTSGPQEYSGSGIM